jgi:hypothetical protein
MIALLAWLAFIKHPIGSEGKTRPLSNSPREASRPGGHRVATRSSEGQIVQFQRRQRLSIAKDEVAEFDKGVVAFGLRASRLDGVQLGAKMR